jgi:5-methylcytosine-specific restriction endonuclease McrA
VPLPRPCLDCSAYAIPGGSRCRSHEAERGAPYRDPGYKAARSRLLFPGARCELQLPGCTQDATQVDHVLPVSKGGTNHLDNLRPSCPHCNASRGNRD